MIVHVSSHVVAGDASARTTTSATNTTAIKHLHMMMSVLAGAQNLLASVTLHVASTVSSYSC